MTTVSLATLSPAEEDPPARPITSLYMVAGCTTNPESVAVAAGHGEAELCESISITPVIEHDGDMEEAAAPVTWSVADWADLSLDCIGNQHDLCFLRMSQDYFDGGDAVEPGTLVTACIHNDCPTLPAPCEPSVCASVTAYAVINLEGAWSLDPIGEPQNLAMDIAQTGRTLFSENGQLDHAFISGFSVFFDRGDYRYIGVIAPDRSHLEGFALDLISFLPAGTWAAHRL